ncbi:replication endonuclease [Vibrio owensii]
MSEYKRFKQPRFSPSTAQYISNMTAHLPTIVRKDIDFKVGVRKRRAGANDRNIVSFAHDVVSKANKLVGHFVERFPFADSASKSQLTHEILMSDERIKELCIKLTVTFQEVIQDTPIDDDSYTGYLSSLTYVYERISQLMVSYFIEPPFVDVSKAGDGEKLSFEDAERILEVAIRRCIDAKYLARKFKRLRQRYIEHAQVTLGNVGDRKHQHCYVSRYTLSIFKQKMREADDFMKNMMLISHESMQEYNLKEVAKRTTANPENRRIELVVRSRGDEEKAIDMGFDGVFLTWTLPSKYHRNSHKWCGCTYKEAHQILMKKWQLARAMLAKSEINWFGLRVAEPHEDGAPHAHMFLYCHPSQMSQLVAICESIARNEDGDELKSEDAKKARFLAKPCDPAKGTATGYIIKYISKNINGAFMPDTEKIGMLTISANDAALSVRAWASAWGIKQFSQSGSPPVGIWRQLRRATAQDVAFDEHLAELREHADKSRWKGFCQHIGEARLAYERSFNSYGEEIKRVIGIDWLGTIIHTCSEQFSLVAKSDVTAWKKARSAATWSTENKCNQLEIKPVTPLESALMNVTGWSLKGVQCLVAPLMRGAKVQIDRYQSVRLSGNQLITC